jgi:hypothetical protein
LDKIYPSGIILVGQISDVRDVMTEKELSDLVGYSYPAALPVEGRPGWLRRYWVLRTSREIDEATCVTLGDLVTRNIRTALLESSVPVAVLDRGAPVIAVNMLDARHAIVRTDFMGPDSGLNLGDAAMAATWGALQQVDAQLEIDELEGFPRRFWKPLAWARSG